VTPSQFAATTILPLLARIVLCLAFLPQGWDNLMKFPEFTGMDAQRLREMGIHPVGDPEPEVTDVSLGALRGEAAWSDGSWNQESPPAVRPVEPAPTLAPTRVDKPSPQAPMHQRRLYALALSADQARLPFPVQLAWTVSAVELVGGACILLGIFSRVWGLLMAVIVVGVFVTSTLPQVKGSWFFGMPNADFNLVFAQMGLLILALSVFLVGPGAFSLDRAIFRRNRARSRKTAPRSG
jgi:uncharacterized membrane protein YphA (DoxX/SURF4 family)